MKDQALEGFLQSVAVDAEQICRDSDCLRLLPDPASGYPPHTYHGVLDGAEHYVRDTSDSFVVSSGPIGFQIQFADDYLKSLDINLQFRVVRTSPDFVHPNVNGGVVCLGGRFRPATRLRPLVEQAYGIFTGRVAAMGHPFDPIACEFFLAHLDTVRGFENQPLWRRPLAASVRVETLSTTPSQSKTEAP